VIGWCMGRWGGRGRDGLMYGAMGRARKGWSDVWGDGKGYVAMGRSHQG